MAITFTNIIVGEGTISIGATEGAAADIGATQDGAEIAWEPDMVDIEVDQFGDAARVVTNKIKVSVKTKLAEGTLENLAYSWNYDESAAISASGADAQYLMMAIQPVYPVEKFIKIVGNAPGTYAGYTLLRTYKCWRCIQYSASSHMLKRAENTAFPVDFRILPDPSQTGYEYGQIIDETA